MAAQNRFRRTLRHLLSTRAEAQRAFPPATLAAIADAITAGEQTHRGEVRLIVEKALPLAAAWDGVTNRQRALALFADYGIWDTEDNCGVLIYVNLAEHKVDIVADRGIDRRIDAATWQAVCDTLTRGFARGAFHDATLDAVAQVNALLRRHFPADGARPNELPDRPLML
ncbi:TPM domain-containing protein [Massilia sp. YIM B02763]|uniref:TPM domain-containing protein n=1 Tax=Massilia sp. YIM B02763 TaxID=3050130 RepID=UPI0025B6815D|nr:TPM domain-containing protein [Massilia sp. YIM B02763]MDN4053120.1 TPM domain-containing protein [Massilia sp. YIM B02763]